MTYWILRDKKDRKMKNQRKETALKETHVEHHKKEEKPHVEKMEKGGSGNETKCTIF